MGDFDERVYEGAAREAGTTVGVDSQRDKKPVIHAIPPRISLTGRFKTRASKELHEPSLREVADFCDMVAKGAARD